MFDWMRASSIKLRKPIGALSRQVAAVRDLLAFVDDEKDDYRYRGEQFS